MPTPELDSAIEAHARAFLAGDLEAAERFVAERGLESHRAAAASAEKKRPLEAFEVPARARIGFQYIAKIRWTGASGRVVAQVRWNHESDRSWKIVEVEDLSGKRSPWSDIPPLKSIARPENTNA